MQSDNVPDQLHPSHCTRSSKSASYDVECINCGATDITDGGWHDLRFECEFPLPVYPTFECTPDECWVLFHIVTNFDQIPSVFICNKLRSLLNTDTRMTMLRPVVREACESLLIKITNILCGNSTLSGWMHANNKHLVRKVDGKQMRYNWLLRLLTHNDFNVDSLDPVVWY